MFRRNHNQYASHKYKTVQLVAAIFFKKIVELFK